MKHIDRVIQRWRIRKAATYIRPGDRVLDIGCADGALFRIVRGLGKSAGVEPELDRASVPTIANVSFYSGYFPEAIPQNDSYDVITMLAVLEHVPVEQQAPLARACAAFLKPGGKLVITVPSPAVDYLLAFMKGLKIIDGMSLEQHYGFEPDHTPGIFSPHGLKLAARRQFQLGLNNLFVFERV